VLCSGRPAALTTPARSGGLKNKRPLYILPKSVDGASQN
jgi:hypothetical protein